jgi:hypothetical protein
MDWAKRFARMCSIRKLGLGLVLAVGASSSGCAETRSYLTGTPPPPMFGVDNASSKASGGDLYAQASRRPGAPSSTAVASARGSKPATGGSTSAPSRDLAVALQTPVAVVADAQAPAGPKPGPAASSLSGSKEPALADSTPNSSRPKEPVTDSVPGAEAEPTVDSIVASARAKLDKLTSYKVSLNRQERVGETLLEPEDVLLSIRRNPRAVRLEWIDGPHKGREVIYAANQHGGLMHINMADSVIRVPRMSMAPDSPLVLKSSRHPITEAGLDTIVANLEKAIDLARQGDMSRGRVSYGGLENPGPLDHPCHKLVRITPSGETWHVYIDPETQLPAMVQATDLQGELLERYVFRNPQADPADLASADAFDPDRRWGAGTDLLGRLARARNAAAQ